MGLVAGQDGFEPVAPQPGPAAPAQPAAAMFRRRSRQPSRRGVLHLQTGADGPVPSDLAAWFTERGFHFYIAALRWMPGSGRSGGRALEAAFAELDARCEHLRTADGIDNVIVTARGKGAVAAARWCAAQRPGPQADALVVYAPDFRRGLRDDLDIPCPVLVIGPDGPDGAGGRRWAGLRRAQPAGAPQLGRHVTWLRPTDGDARPDAPEPADRGRFFDEMGRWLGAYMYGHVRDQLL